MFKDIIIPHNSTAVLMFENGRVLFGQAIGKFGETTGEICFNTALTGYQEILTDPSYAGQIINFTFPHIGNIGVNKEDIETLNPRLKGVIFRNSVPKGSSFRMENDLNSWLVKNNISGICNIDTRAVTRIIRTEGSSNVLIAHYTPNTLPNLEELYNRLKSCRDMNGLDLAIEVTCEESFGWDQTRWNLQKGYQIHKGGKYRVTAIDYGAKLNILRSLVSRNCELTILPAEATFEEIMATSPDGVFLSNGPGDPAATAVYAAETIRQVVDSGTPLFGICLGHQLLALAMGAKTEKMAQGHRGANHPVKDLKTGKVEITSQNHGFSVTKESLPENVEITHISLFDGTIEGIEVKGKKAFSVQYHPESSPGPHDSHYLFDRFIEQIEMNQAEEKVA